MRVASRLPTRAGGSFLPKIRKNTWNLNIMKEKAAVDSLDSSKRRRRMMDNNNELNSVINVCSIKKICRDCSFTVDGGKSPSKIARNLVSAKIVSSLRCKLAPSG